MSKFRWFPLEWLINFCISSPPPINSQIPICPPHMKSKRNTDQYSASSKMSWGLGVDALPIWQQKFKFTEPRRDTTLGTTCGGASSQKCNKENISQAHRQLMLFGTNYFPPGLTALQKYCPQYCMMMPWLTGGDPGLPKSCVGLVVPSTVWWYLGCLVEILDYLSHV